MLAGAIAVAPFLAVYALAALVDNRAGARAERIIAAAQPGEDVVAFASDLTAGVHLSFTQEVEAGSTITLIHRARPYWTNDLVPAFLRPSEGALDLLVASGACDAYARALVFVMERTGFEAAQLNLVSRGGGHSITIARTQDGQTLLLDPEHALIAVYRDSPIDPDTLRALVLAGKNPVNLWSPILPRNGTPPILETFDYGLAHFAKQGELMKMVDTVSLDPGQILTIGDANGHQIDHASLLEAGLYGNWHYLGSRYDRSWVRVMKFEQDTKVVIRTTEAPRQRFVTTNKKPQINGREIVYTVPAGGALVFTDGAAGRDWRRLRSYQAIDAVTFVSLE